MSLQPRSALLSLLVLLLLAGCDGGTDPPPQPDGPRTVLDVARERLALPEPPPGSLPVAVGVFLTVPSSLSAGILSADTAAARIGAMLRGASGILAQCGLHLEPEVAQVVALPGRLLDVQGNERGSWGGHPPDSVGNPDLFTYRQNERLTAETRELFAFGKRHASRNAISVFTVRSIEYYVGEQRTGAGGLSFPPNAYHHADDYPLRNSVLLVGTGGAAVPSASPRTLAHEVGHMLLNSGSHVASTTNLMGGGTGLTEAQCERMRGNRERLFGAEAVPDPGPPTGGGG